MLDIVTDSCVMPCSLTGLHAGMGLRVGIGAREVGMGLIKA